MKKAVRWAIVCASVLTAVNVTFAHTNLASAAGLDFWNINQLRTRLGQAEDLDRLLEMRLSAVRTRIFRKLELVGDLLDDRRSFDEVVEEFRFLREEARRESGRPRTDDPGNEVHDFAMGVANSQPDEECRRRFTERANTLYLEYMGTPVP